MTSAPNRLQLLSGSKLIVLIILIFLFTACGQEKEYYLSQGEIFHTVYHIKYESTNPLDSIIHAELRQFDLSLNPFNNLSTIYKINNNIEVEVDDWFVTVFNKSKEVSEKSQGAFDITAAPLINLWGFGFSKKDSVTPQVVDSLKSLVGYQKIFLEGRKIIKLNPNIQLNASAIAKGYACDVIAQLLDLHGIDNYMIEIGGEIRMKGKSPTNECWKIEITKPQDDIFGLIQQGQEILQICDGALATSGNYRNFYVKDGKKYGHTINPMTGYPSEQNILSASVVAPDCMTADAYATVFMVLGLDAASKLGDSMPELAYYFVYADDKGNHQVKYSRNMEKNIVKETIEQEMIP